MAQTLQQNEDAAIRAGVESRAQLDAALAALAGMSEAVDEKENEWQAERESLLRTRELTEEELRNDITRAEFQLDSALSALGESSEMEVTKAEEWAKDKLDLQVSALHIHIRYIYMACQTPYVGR